MSAEPVHVLTSDEVSERRLAWIREKIAELGYYEAWRYFLGRGALGNADAVARAYAQRP